MLPFPSNNQFTALTVAGQPYFDLVGDESPASTDLVGNANFPSFFVAYDGTNVYFRIRLNADPRNNTKTAFQNFAWGILFNTDGVPGTYEWDLSVNGKTGRLELIQNTDKKMNTWNDPAEGTNGQGAPNFARNIVNFDVARVTPADSNFGGNPDFFLDFFIAANTLFSFLGITETSAVQLISFTSADANNFNKDSLRTEEGFQFRNAFSNPVTAVGVDVKADLDVTKTLVSGPSTVTAGSIAQYTARIDVSNIGKSSATTIFVRDVIGLDIISDFTITSASAGNATFDSASQTLSWNIGNLNPGSSATLTFRVTGFFRNAGTQTLETATVTGFDSFTGNQIDPDTDRTMISVRATGGVAGTVSNRSDGLPLTGATVQLQQGGATVATTTTNASGNYSLINITSGDYTLVVSNNNFTTLTRPIAITSGNITTANVLLTPLPGSIQGRVTNTSGSPVPNAVVTLNNTFGVLIIQTNTDGSGQYVFNNVSPDQYNLTVNADGFQSASQGVQVNPNQTVNANFTLNPNPATVQGQVTDTNGNPVSGASVEVINNGGLVVAMAMTNINGQYAINSLAPDTYRLRVSQPNFTTEVLGFTVNAGEVETLNIRLSPNPGALTGTVTTVAGIPLVGASIRIVDQFGFTVATTLTGTNGRYTVNSLSPGVYSVTFSADGFGSQTLSTMIDSNQTTTLNAALTQLAGTLSGLITNTAGNPIPGAVIKVFLNNVIVASAITDQNGNYTISGLAPNTYTVVTSADEFSSTTAGITILSDQVTTLNTQLQANPGTLTGSVTTNNGQPIPGAAIVVRNSDSNTIVARTVTDDNGNYVVMNLSPELYTVTATADNFQTEVTGATIMTGQTTTVNFQLMSNPASIVGTITNAQTGQPIAGASIEIRILDANGAVVASTFTDPDGNYLVMNLSSGTFTVVVSAADFQTNGGSVALGPGETGNVNIALLPSPGSIQGTILNANTGNGITGATVKVIDPNGLLVKTVLTDSQGEYTADGLATGNYTVLALADGFQNSSVGAIVQVNTTTPINIELAQNPGAIQGTVTPVVDGTVVQLLTADNQFVATVPADPQGNFQFNNLTTGEYVLLGSAPDFSVSRAGATVIASKTTTIEITLQPNPAMVSGRVTDAGEEPIFNATVKIIGPNEIILGTGLTDTNGIYAIGNLPSGTFSVLVSAPDFSTVSRGVTLLPGEDVTGLNIQLTANPGAIAGQITDTAGNPIPGAVVLLRTSTGTFVSSVNTSPFGNYLIEGLAPDSYVVVAGADNFSTESVGAIVRSNQQTGADLVLSSTVGNIRGRIVDQNGNSITGNNLQVRLLSDSGLLLRTFLAEPDGTFMVFDLSPGRYLLNVSTPNDPSFTANTVAVDVVSGQTTSIAIALSPTPAIVAGRVINGGTGEGITGVVINVTTTDGIFLARAISGDNGQFTIQNLPPGIVVISANAIGFGADGVSALLKPNETTNVTLSLSPDPGGLTGFITNLQTSDPIPGSVIMISKATGAVVATVVSDAFGRFLVPSLDPGAYRAVASADRFSTEIATLDIVSDQTTILSFALFPNPGVIQGTVVDQVTRQPVIGAAVVARLLSPSGPIVATTITDEQGQYVLSGLAPGTYTAIVTSENFGSASATTTVSAGTTVTLDFLLLQNPAVVQGTVRSARTRDPLSNAVIRMFDVGGILIQSVQTDSTGLYRLNGFSAGQYRLVAIHLEFQRKELSFTASAGEVVTVDFNLEPNPGNISGRITDTQTTSPLVGALVLVFGASNIDPIARAVTDNLGNYFIGGLSPDTYTVVASALQFSRNSVGVAVQSNQTSIANLSLIPNPAAISGGVTSTKGDPIINATVKVIDNNGVVFGTAATDSNGEYSLSNLPAGTFTVLASATGFSNAQNGITLQRGGELNNVDFVLTPDPGRIVGTVVNIQTGEPIQGATINIKNQNGISLLTTITDENGQYIAFGLAPDSYTVVGSQSGFSPAAVGAVVISDQTTIANLFLNTEFGTITGRVLDLNGKPITSTQITVRLSNEKGVILQTIIAAADGSFTLTNIKPGRYLINVVAEGFQSTVVPVIVEAGETTDVTIQLESQGGTVTGNVINAATGSAIDAAQITVTDLNGIVLATGISDQTGSFTISSLPPGSLNITATKSGFGADSKAIIVESGETTMTTLALAPNPGNLQGAVVNQRTGNPISGATITLIDFTGAVVSTVLSQTNGEYAVFNLAPGSYQAIATAENFDTQITGVDTQPNETVITNFQLKPDPGNFAGIVSDGNTGDPIAGVSIQVRTLGPSGPVVATTLTDTEGRYVVTGLPPGVYTVAASRKGFGTAEASDEVNSNQTTTQNLILFPRPSSVEGRVVRADTGESLANTVIRLINSVGAVIKEVQTDIDGFYLIEQFDAGSYSIVALNPDFQSQLKEFSVGPNETAEVHFRLQENPGSAVGQVTDSVSGNPISGAVITVFDEQSRPIVNTISDKNGNYEIEGLNPGTFTIRASALRFAAKAKTVTVQPNQTTSVNFALARNPAQIRGTVTDDPLFDAGVSVFDNNGNLVGRGLTGPNGEYVIGNLPAGTFTVTATAPGFPPESKTIRLSPGKEEIVNFILTRPGVLTGVVTNGATGDPVSNATVRVRALGPSGPIVATTSTDQNGRYVVSGLRPGVYTVSATKEGFGSAEASDAVRSGETTTQNLVLFPETASVQGRVVDAATGRPLPGTLVRLISAAGVLIKEIQTDQDGFYRVDQFSPGSFSIVAFNPEFQSERKEFSVRSGETATVNFALKGSPGTLSGRVTDRVSGESISGAVVIVFDERSRPIISTMTDENGNYIIKGLAPGTYSVRATAFGFAADAKTAVIQANQTTVVNFTLARNPSRIRGIVTDDPIIDAVVSVYDSNGNLVGRGLTGPNGGYLIGNLPAGTFTVTATATGFLPEAKTVTISPGEEQVVNFILGETPRLTDENEFILVPIRTNQPLDLTGSGSPTLFRFNKFDSATGCSFLAYNGGGVEKVFVTQFSLYSVIRL